MSSVSFRDLFQVFGKIGLTSFGGPAAQIAMMHDALVEDSKWLTERQFLSALSFCMLLPGPEAMQLATYSGWRLRGVRGGLLAGTLFVLPGAALILVLALGYAAWGTAPMVQTVFLGVKAAVVVIVLQALTRVGKKALRGPKDWLLAVGSFVAIFAFDVPFPILVAVAAVIGAVLAAPAPEAQPVALPSSRGTFRLLATWGALWIVPILYLYLSGASFLSDVALFFSKLAIVTFGGAYAVLAYMAQEVVGNYQWLTAHEMVDALGLAETTPGPLILVTEFVGALAGYKTGGVALAVGTAALVLWVTFVPCFLWIFVGAPYIEWIAAQSRFASALSAITAAVVGVILNLSLWFTLHVLFTQVDELLIGPLSLPMPQPASWQPSLLGLVTFAGVVLFWGGQSMLRTLLLTASAAFLLGLL